MNISKFSQTGTISVKELFNTQPRDIIIPESTEVVISPNSSIYGNLYKQVNLKSIDDLKAMNLISSQIDSEKVIEAIQNDDAEAIKLAKKNFKLNTEDCHCNSKKSQGSLQSAYSFIRNQSHFELSKLLSGYFIQQMKLDSIEVRHTYKWINLVGNFYSPVISVLFANDITINRNSTMILDSKTHSIKARDIRIYAGGKMQLDSSYLFIKCASAQGNLGNVDKHIRLNN